MPIQTYSVRYNLTGVGAFTALSNVQSIELSHGRHRQLDTYAASRCTVRLRYPNGYTSPIADLVPGCVMQVLNVTGATQTLFVGRIADLQVEYGMLYQAGVGNADYLTINIEGNLARLGRAAGNDYVIPSTRLKNQVSNMEAQTGITSTYEDAGSDPVLSAFTVSSNWGEWTNRALTTINGRLWDGFDSNEVRLVSPFYKGSAPFRFSDTANNATNQVYDQITFGSYADNYYTQVTVDPDTLSPVTVSAVGATAPFRTLQTNTLNSTTAQATDYANYLLSNFADRNPKIVSISCTAEQQNSFALDQVGYLSFGIGTVPGHTVEIVFRGSTVQCVIEGVSVSATPDGSRYTFYVSGADLNAYLVLNDTVFGKLDSNKLGY
jgi:hypothetical protein